MARALSFVRNILFVALAAGAGAAIFLYLLYLVMDFQMNLETPRPVRFIPNASDARDFLCLFCAGYAFAAPALFCLYFPAAMALWKRKSRAWMFAALSLLIAAPYGWCVFAFLNREDGNRNFAALNLFGWLIITGFSFTGVLTGFFHHRLLHLWRRRSGGIPSATDP